MSFRKSLIACLMDSALSQSSLHMFLSAVTLKAISSLLLDSSSLSALGSALAFPLPLFIKDLLFVNMKKYFNLVVT